MLPYERPRIAGGFVRGQPSNSQDEETTAAEEDALVLRMEEMMAETDREERLSFADSERFDDDEEQFSAQASESSSLSHHWRGWAGRTGTDVQINSAAKFVPDSSLIDPAQQTPTAFGGNEDTLSVVVTLKDLAARRVASSLSFEIMECTYAQLPSAQKRLVPKECRILQDCLPEQLVLLIIRHCFPDSAENIRLYSCLTNCGDRLFSLGEQLFQSGAVSELFQIGYHLSAIVHERGPCQPQLSANASSDNSRRFDVCIRVDRCRIVACSCSCSNASFWCQHAVAACLQRIQRPDSVEFRPAIWDSITGLRDKELKKLTQYLINELPREYIPVAQKLIDALKQPQSKVLINRTHGAPDPTAGPTDDTPAVWCMNERALQEEVRKTLVNFMRPQAMVCEVQSLLTSPPALAHEWSILHRTLCAKQPESLWNLLAMVRVMLSRGDANGPALLHVLTEQCLALDSVLLRWYQISLAASGFWQPTGPGQRGNAQQSQSRQLNVFLLCQELAQLWRLVALNPRLNPAERERLWALLQLYQRTAVARIWTILGKMAQTDNNMFGTVVDSRGHRLSQQNAPFSRPHFPAFFPALAGCRQLDWAANSEMQRLAQAMDCGSRLSTDIQLTRRQIDRFPNLPFLHDSPDGLFLLDLVEMERQLGNAEAYNPDAVLLPSKSSRRRKGKRRKCQQKRGSKGSEKEKESMRGGGRKSDGTGSNGNSRPDPSTSSSSRLEKEPSSRRRDSNELEQLSEVSSEEELGFGNAPAASSNAQQREPFDEALDSLFAEAHAELDDPLALRFTCCEALFSHGYFRESLQLADQLAQQLMAAQPNLLPPPNHHSNSNIGFQRAEEASPEAAEASSSSCQQKHGNPSLLPSCHHHHQFRHPFSSGADSFRRPEGGGPGSGRGWLWRSHPRLMASSQLSRDNLCRTLFLTRLLLLGEQFMAKKRSRSQRERATVGGGQSFGPEPGHFRLRALELCLATLCNCRGPAATKLLEMEINHLEAELFSLLHQIELCPLGLELVRSLARQQIGHRRDRAVIVPPTRLAHYVLNALSYSHNVHVQHSHAHHQNQMIGTGGGRAPQSSSAADALPLPPCSAEVFVHRQPADDDLALSLALLVLSIDVHISETDHPLLCECIRRHRKDLQMCLLTRNRDCPEKLARVLGTVMDPKVHRMYEDHHRSNVDFFLPAAQNASMRPVSSAAQNATAAEDQSADLLSNSSRPPPPPPSSHSSSGSSSSAVSSPSISPFQVSRQISTESRRSSVEEANVSAAENESSHSPKLATTTKQRRRLVILDRYAPMFSPSAAAGPHVIGQAAVSANQASEAQAHHMFEFAKSLLQEAGGNQSSAMFNPLLADGIGVPLAFPGGPAAAGIGAGGGPHRNLHICSLLVALYALGLNNECAHSWNTRTYSTHVSWIQAQALDIGKPALEIVRRTWRKHLTPTEVASLADKASQNADQAVVEEAAQLALSVLPEANSLLPTESQKALNQCKERSARMLEEACLAVEKAAKRGGVYPEVLFRVAHHWYDDLYRAHLLKLGTGTCQTVMLPAQQQQQQLFSLMQPKQQQQPLFAQMSMSPMMPAAAAAAPFFSPSVPPPPLPAGTVGIGGHRLQPSLSTPNMSNSGGGLQQHMCIQQQQQFVTVSLPPLLMPPNFSGAPSFGIHHSLKQPHPPPLLQMSSTTNSALLRHQPPCRADHRNQTASDERATQLLKNAHRVGIAAMNNLRSTESVFSKFAKNPPSSDEICWLLDVSLEITDPEYVRLFCEKAIVCVNSPFVLFELLRATIKRPPSVHRVPGTGQLNSILQSASSDLAKHCLQQAKSAMTQHAFATFLMELALHTIGSVFSAASHKLNFNSFNAADQEYVCDLSLLARDIFRLIPPYHEHYRRKYMELFMEHMQKQKCFKKFKSVQVAVQNALQQPRTPLQQQQQQQWCGPPGS